MTMKPFHSNIQNPNDHEVIMNFEYYEAQLKRLEVEEKKLELSTRLKFNAQQQQFRLDQERIQLLKSLLVTAVNEENCTGGKTTEIREFVAQMGSLKCRFRSV
jgi:hypothetical protein